MRREHRRHFMRSLLDWLSWIASFLLLAQLAWKHLMVARFFQRPLPIATREPALVSILIAVYSDDPALPHVLAHNLAVHTRYALEFLFLVDDTDLEGQRICAELVANVAARPDRTARMLVLPGPDGDVNPKMIKLIAGAREVRGDALCVLDDDTRLPDDGLEQCIPFLDSPRVGLAFGLPYYTSFATLWDALVSTFVNSNSLLTYIPYTTLSEPFTLNGMFYVLRREVYDAVGGFEGLERFVSDDFAVASHLRAAGYRLAQSPMLHAITTTVHGPRHYFRLIQRWMLFPRESLLRHLDARQRALLVGIALVPALYPLLLLLALLRRPSRGNALRIGVWLGVTLADFVHLNRAYLRGATPVRRLWLHPLMQLLFPVQLLVALFSPNRMDWRGRKLSVQRGGTLRYERTTLD